MCNGIAIVVLKDGDKVKVFCDPTNGSHDKLMSREVPVEKHNDVVKLEYIFPGIIKLDCPDKECRDRALELGLVEKTGIGESIRLKIGIYGIVVAKLEHITLAKWDKKLMQGADLSNADLSEVDLSKANLSEANLHWADLREANLSEANLSGTDLREANLSEANLRGADLHVADLSKADLGKADLSEVYLSRANLSKANLREADLRRANLRWADLRDANLRGTDLSGTDLSRANLRGANLENVLGISNPGEIN